LTAVRPREAANLGIIRPPQHSFPVVEAHYSPRFIHASCSPHSGRFGRHSQSGNESQNVHEHVRLRAKSWAIWQITYRAGVMSLALILTRFSRTLFGYQWASAFGRARVRRLFARVSVKACSKFPDPRKAE